MGFLSNGENNKTKDIINDLLKKIKQTVFTEFLFHMDHITL